MRELDNKGKKRVLSNWYYSMNGLEALRVFITKTEEQIKNSIVDYEKKKELVPQDNEKLLDYINDDGLPWYRYDLDKLYKEYFPNLQRKSLLITLFNDLEYSLNVLCIRFKQAYNYTIDIEDIKGNGIERYATYLDKVCGMKNCKSVNEWATINQIRVIRNLIVHHGGKLEDIEGNKKEKENNIVKNTSSLEALTRQPSIHADSEVGIKEGYLLFVLNAFDKYFKILDIEINKLDDIKEVHNF